MVFCITPRSDMGNIIKTHTRTAIASPWRTLKVRVGLCKEIECLIKKSKMFADVPKYQSLSEFVNEGAARLLRQEKKRRIQK
jgi:hypothetical protein